MHLLSFALAALVAGAASAQQFSSLEERMTEEQFKAAGLDKLSPEELARLNAFIARETEQVASSLPAATPAEVDNRGFSGRSGPQGEIISSISGQFSGWKGAGDRFTLDNGQVWQVTDSATRLSVNLVNPEVVIEPGAFNSWSLRVVGYNTRAKVKRIK
ncbi:hypothetical protein C6N40_02050 [Arenimonas caeni]|jgi:hypothetical protein|uniref:Secreted protein n=2 Tax=Arenimonas caeni TaxID=2058085 RepID=A0A2P6MBS8_9GAMM|nr:hypothetical protein C6N40_02050 [Arenimonas caeni]